MGFTIGQADDVNQLLRWVLDLPHEYSGLAVAVTDDKAHDAVMRLTGHARRALGAGLTLADVEAAWPEQGGGPAAVRRELEAIKAHPNYVYVTDGGDDY